LKIVFQGSVKEDVDVNVLIASLLYFFIIKNGGSDILGAGFERFGNRLVLNARIETSARIYRSAFVSPLIQLSNMIALGG